MTPAITCALITHGTILQTHMHVNNFTHPAFPLGDMHKYKQDQNSEASFTIFQLVDVGKLKLDTYLEVLDNCKPGWRMPVLVASDRLHR